jgi:hypothetical protein
MKIQNYLSSVDLQPSQLIVLKLKVTHRSPDGLGGLNQQQKLAVHPIQISSM